VSCQPFFFQLRPQLAAADNQFFCVALSYLSGYEGIALFSRLFLNEPADITFKTPRFLTFKPAERILTRVSIAWFLVAFFLVKTTGFELALPVSNIGKLLS